MTGVPGRSGGHNRKRSDQKLGNAKHAADHSVNRVDKPQATGVAAQPALVFPGGEKPLTMVRNLWDSMARSGFHEYYTDADWRAAMILLYNLNQILNEMLDKGKTTAMKMQEIRAIFTDLMVTESARRRLHLEVQRADDSEPPMASVSHLDLARDIA